MDPAPSHRFGIPRPSLRHLGVVARWAAIVAVCYLGGVAATNLSPTTVETSFYRAVVRLDPLPAPRHTAAIDELCQTLNDTHTVYPGTTLTLRYSTKPHRRPHINS